MEKTGSAQNHRYLILLLLIGCATPKPMQQNPSPMVENTRAHERLQRVDTPSRKIEGLLAKPIEVGGAGEDLLIHFHGAAWLPLQSVKDRTVAVVNLGAGGGLYDRAFSDPSVFTKLVAAIPHRKVYLSGFSAGYGAIRAILRNHADEIEGVLLLDGLHTSYPLDTTQLEPFVAFARRAIAGEKVMVITHSEIFPGTFASTTETTDSLIAQLGLKRTPVIKWGPGGMQQLSEVRAGRLTILGFAGNSAPDHIDHLHGMPIFVELLR